MKYRVCYDDGSTVHEGRWYGDDLAEINFVRTKFEQAWRQYGAYNAWIESSEFSGKLYKI